MWRYLSAAGIEIAFSGSACGAPMLDARYGPFLGPSSGQKCPPLKSEVHDAVTRRASSLRKSLRAAILLKQAGVPVAIKSPLLAEAEDAHLISSMQRSEWVWASTWILRSTHDTTVAPPPWPRAPPLRRWQSSSPNQHSLSPSRIAGAPDRRRFALCDRAPRREDSRQWRRIRLLHVSDCRRQCTLSEVC